MSFFVVIFLTMMWGSMYHISTFGMILIAFSYIPFKKMMSPKVHMDLIAIERSLLAKNNELEIKREIDNYVNENGEKSMSALVTAIFETFALSIISFVLVFYFFPSAILISLAQLGEKNVKKPFLFSVMNLIEFLCIIAVLFLGNWG